MFYKLLFIIRLYETNQIKKNWVSTNKILINKNQNYHKITSSCAFQQCNKKTKFPIINK